MRYDEDGYIEIHCIHGRYRQGTHKYDIPHLSFYKNIHTGYEFDISLKGYDFEGNLYLKITELSFIKPWNKYVEREQKKMPELMRTFMINNWKRMHK